LTSLVKRVWKWFAGLFAVVAILLALLIGVFRIVVTHAPDYRQPIADWASRTLGLPVEIRRVDARLGLYGPELIFRDATILSAPGGEPLVRAGRGSVSLDLKQLLLRWQVKADRLALDGLQLEIDRSESGEILVFGRPLAEFRQGEAELPIEEIRIEGARLVIRDRMEGGRTWVLEDVETRVARDSGGLRVEGRFSPPAGAAAGLDFWVNSYGVEGWRAYVAAREVDLAVLADLPGLPFSPPTRGNGDLRLWVDTDAGQVSRVSVQAAIQDLGLPAAEGVPEGSTPPLFRMLEGRVEWDRRPTGWRARIADLVVAGEGPQWRSETIMVEKSVTAAGDQEHLFLDADFVRADDLLGLIPSMPQGELRQTLAAVEPRGDITALSVAVSTTVTDVRESRVEFRADLEGFSSRPYGKLPGVSGLSGTVRSDPQGGRIELEGQQTEIELTELFRAPLRFDRVQGLVVWSKGDDGITVIGDDIRAGNPDLALQTGFRLRIPTEGGEGRLDVQATARDVDLASASRYLPVGIMRDKLVNWLDSAIVSGHVPVARLRLEGPVTGFPYPNGEGLFEVTFGAHGLVLDYAAGWPAGQAITADFQFRNEGFSATLREGDLSGMAVGDIDVEIPELRQGRLSIKGGARGRLADVQRYVLDSPVRETLGPALAETHIDEGRAEVLVDLLLPLKNLAAREVHVELDIEEASVRYGYVTQPLSAAAGKILVSRNLVWSENLTGVFLGEPVEIAVVTPEGGGTRAEFSGLITDVALVESLGIPLEGFVDGKAPWRGTAHFPRKDNDEGFWIRLESGLAGMEWTLPDPLAKTREEVRSLVVDFHFPGEGRTEWIAKYDDQCSAAAAFRTGTGRLEFQKGQIRCGPGDAILPDDNGLFIEGEVERLPVSEWLAVRFGDRGEGRLEDLLKRLDLQAADTVFGGQRLGAVSATLEQEEPDWLLTLEGEAVAGGLRIPMKPSPDQPVVVVLERLHIDDDERDTSTGMLDPRDVLSMDITVEDYQDSGLNLGRLDASVRSVPNGFYVEDFSFAGPAFTITGNMRSVLGFGRDESSLSMLVKTTDLGEAMEFMGFTRSLESNNGEFAVDVSWQGGIPPDILAVAEGTASLRLKNGSMTDVKPGAGRVFGLLSVQALPRRLILDFRDVFKKGFFFDELKGDFRISAGEAFTDNLVLRSPAADIGIVGTVNLTERLYDQTAIVSAEVGNTLPVVGAIAAGPAIGAGLFVLKEIFKEPLRGIAQVQYRITGPWEEPAVDRVATAEELGGQQPGDRIPGDQAPGDQAPGDQAPGDQAPGDQVPGDQVPGDQVPGDQVPGDQVPGDQAPGDQAPGETAQAGNDRG
jgi:uncharacterized protein (TIGR02099 family)